MAYTQVPCGFVCLKIEHPPNLMVDDVLHSNNIEIRCPISGETTPLVLLVMCIYISIQLDPHSIPVMLRLLDICLRQLHFESFFIFKSQVP